MITHFIYVNNHSYLVRPPTTYVSVVTYIPVVIYIYIGWFSVYCSYQFCGLISTRFVPSHVAPLQSVVGYESATVSLRSMGPALWDSCTRTLYTSSPPL